MLFTILFPICAVVFLGYIAARTQFITPSLIMAMSQFVMKISLPAFLLQALASKHLSDIWSPQYFIAYAGGSLLLYGVVFFCCRYFFKASLTESGVLAMGGGHVQYRVYRHGDTDLIDWFTFSNLSFIDSYCRKSADRDLDADSG